MKKLRFVPLMMLLSAPVLAGGNWQPQINLPSKDPGPIAVDAQDLEALTELVRVYQRRRREENEALLRLQERMSREAGCTDAVSKVLKAIHDVQMDTISKLRGWVPTPIQISPPVASTGSAARLVANNGGTPLMFAQTGAGGVASPFHAAVVMTSPTTGKHYFVDHTLGPGVSIAEMTSLGGGKYAPKAGQERAIAGSSIWNDGDQVWSAFDPRSVPPGTTCSIPITPKQFPFEARTSTDPNEKAGPGGPGEARFLPADEPLRYVVFFENTPTATAAAREVVVSDKLEAANLDLDSLSLGPISFGTHTVTPPPGVRQHAALVDLRPAYNLAVRVVASFEVKTATLTWRFTTLDPTTGLAPDDPLVGFLPPNKRAPEGDGSVAFFVRSKGGLPSGTTISNGADIVFDSNAAIKTNAWSNTLDAAAPSSRMQALPATQAAGTFELRWSGDDRESGVLDYTIWVSEDGGPYQIWQLGMSETSRMFHGQPGRSYRFFSVARDRAGNAEDAKTEAEASTQVAGGADAAAPSDGGAPSDGPSAEGGPPTAKGGGGGCGCRTIDRPDVSGASLLATLALTLVLGRRFRRSRTRVRGEDRTRA